MTLVIGRTSRPRKQVPRYECIGKLVSSFSPRNVLDVGCGEAILKKYLSESIFYLGIEPSAKAANGRPDTVHLTAEDFPVREQRWDCIVFNEMLYYSNNPAYLLKKFSGLLAKDGRIIVSIYQNPRTPPFRKRLMYLIDPRRPISNLHCGEMVYRHVFRERWMIDSDQLLPGAKTFRVWMIRPNGIH